MARAPRLVDPSRPNLENRNRHAVRVLLAIVLALAVATILVGIRW